MQLLARMRHLLTADVHGILDGLESNLLSMRQDLRELGRALEVKSTLYAERAQIQERLARTRARLAQESERIDADLELALAADKDDLARHCIARRFPLTEELRTVGEELEQLARSQLELAATVARQAADHAALSSRVEAAGARHAARSTCEPHSAAALRGTLSEHEIELELIRQKQRRAARALEPSA